MTMQTLSRREQLLRCAIDLFYRQGIQATGVEQILSTAETSKPTLYRHFNSKSELIVAALSRWDEDSRAFLTSEARKRGDTPRAQILAFFDALGVWFATPDFSGCFCMNAAIEFPDHDDPIHQVAVAHKNHLFAFLHGLLEEAGARDPDETAAKLMILVEGAIITAHYRGEPELAARARDMASEILDGAVPSG